MITDWSVINQSLIDWLLNPSNAFIYCLD